MSALPPGPRSALWSLYRYVRDPVYCMVPLAKKYGETFTFPGKPPLVCAGDPASIKAIYTADPDSLAPLNTTLGEFIGPRSLILLAGAEHRKARKLMSPPFHGARMRAYGETIVRLAEQRSADWRPGQTIDMIEAAQKISLDVILQTIFGVTEPEKMATLAKSLIDITQKFSPLIAMVPALRREFGGIGPYAAYARRRRELYAQLDALIAAGKAAGPREDILSLLLAARDEEGRPMPDDEVRDQLILLVFAGHETTALTIGWAMYALHRPENAAVLERLRAELAALGPEPSPAALDKQEYLAAVLDETLRRFPLAPAPNPRKLLRPLELPGCTVPAGVAVAPAIGIAHFREEAYPEPMTFRPERFIGKQFTPFEFLPYGGGARRCLGAALAGYEMRLVVGTLIRRFRFRAASLKPDHGKVRAVNAGPSYGARVVVEERLA